MKDADTTVYAFDIGCIPGCMRFGRFGRLGA
jgi:hypothetical protein